MRKIDRNVEFERLAGPCLVAGLAIRQAYRPRQRDDWNDASLVAKASLAQGFEERRGTPIHDRRFWSVYVDHDVMNVRPGDGRKHVLDRVNRNRGFADRRAARRQRGIRDARGDRARSIEMRAAEYDAVIRGRWMKRQPNRHAKVQAHTLERDGTLDCPST